MPDEVKRYAVIDDPDCEGNLWSNDFGPELQRHGPWSFVLAEAYDALEQETIAAKEQRNEESRQRQTAEQYAARLAAELAAARAERDKLAAELAEVRATVSEWACETCRYVYPGPPQAGFKCVVCPRCGGSTMPHELLRTREAEAERDHLAAEVGALRQAFDPETLAWRFHEAYERLAPDFGYVTRPESRTWDVTSTNAKLMLAVAKEISSSALLAGERGAGQIDANTLEVGKRHAVKLTGEMSGVAGAVTITERGEGIVRPEWKDGGSVPTVFVQTGAWFRCSQCGQEMEHTEIDAHLAQHGLVPLTHPKATPAHE